MKNFTKSWMSSIDDSQKISEFSIPGTHDSGMHQNHQFPFHEWALCQNMTIEEQLNNGIRFLDIRCRANKENKLEVYHGQISAGFGFDHVIEVCQGFLETNPSETILMSLKPEGKNENTKDYPYYKIVQGYTEKSGAYKKWYTENHLPIMGEVRGKIILFRRFSMKNADGKPAANQEYGIEADIGDSKITHYATDKHYYGWLQINPISNEYLYFEDWYSPKNVDEKKEVIQSHLRLSCTDFHPNDLLWTFTSGTITKWFPPSNYNPKEFANKINPWLLQTMNSLSGDNMGVVIMDFVQDNLIQPLLPKFQISHKIKSGIWKEKLDSGCLYYIGDEAFLYQYNSSNGHYFISKISDQGCTPITPGNWHWQKGYCLTCTYCFNDNVYLYHYNPDNGNYFFANLTDVTSTSPPSAFTPGNWKWQKGYCTGSIYSFDNRVWLYQYNPDDGKYFFADLTGVTSTNPPNAFTPGNWKWQSGFSFAQIFSIEDKPYLYHYNHSDGCYFLAKLDNVSPSVPPSPVNPGNWHWQKGYKSGCIYAIDNYHYLIQQSELDRNWFLAAINSISAKNPPQPTSDQGGWKEYNNILLPFKFGGVTFLYGFSKSSATNGWWIRKLK